MQGGMGGRLGYIVALPFCYCDRVPQPPMSNTILVEWSQQVISNTGPDMGCGIREVRRVPVELRGARGPVRHRVTRNASGQDGRLDPVVVHREVHHAVVIAAVAIEPNLGDVRGGQSQVRAGPDVREALRRRRRSRARHQIWVGARLVIVRRHQEPAVKVLDQHPLVDGTKWRWRRRQISDYHDSRATGCTVRFYP